MSRVVRVPERLDESSFETLVRRVRAEGNPQARLLLDARSVGWVSPYGLIGLLAIGQEARLRTGLPPLIEPPRAIPRSAPISTACASGPPLHRCST